MLHGDELMPLRIHHEHLLQQAEEGLYFLILSVITWGTETHLSLVVLEELNLTVLVWVELLMFAEMRSFRVLCLDLLLFLHVTEPHTQTQTPAQTPTFFLN